MASQISPNEGTTARRLISIKQAIFELGIGRTSIYDLIRDQKLKTVRIGRRRFVTVEAIEEFITSLNHSWGGR